MSLNTALPWMVALRSINGLEPGQRWTFTSFPV